jgi:N-acetylglucosaminyl-diphospho-decaprenol L-rhamnosyltransferase
MADGLRLTFCRIPEKIVLRNNTDRMILSVVIVSYNVKFFLEQCLSSLKKAVERISIPGSRTEVFIIDNASSDGSLDFLRPLFPVFHFIQNKENTGFAKANNQGLTLCSGELVLFLNPDTILAEDSLDLCISFFLSTPDAGALGLHMINGAGIYLKESKRGFPSPVVSFYKMSGLSRLFPRSKVFSAYYMGHLHERTTHVVDVLPGAFMMVRKKALDVAGGFDEQFFMYAEDIDLSYRISQSGYRNYYLAGSSVIHFKGESTRKDFQYVKQFHRAMDLFMKKHFSGPGKSMKLFSLSLAVQVYQVLSYLRLPFKNSIRKKKTRLRIFIKGEREALGKWKSKLDEIKNPVSETEADAEEIIYCEGPHHSWKSIIAEITNSKKRILYKFHGTGTHAAVGSYSSREQGDIFEL